MTPQFRAALTMAAAGMFSFVAGVSITGNHRTVGLAAAATGALLLAVAFPRLWAALPGLPTGRIYPPITSTAPDPAQLAGPVVDLFGPPPDKNAPPDRIEALEAEVEALRLLLAEQADLVAAGYAALRREITGGT